MPVHESNPLSVVEIAIGVNGQEEEVGWIAVVFVTSGMNQENVGSTGVCTYYTDLASSREDGYLLTQKGKARRSDNGPLFHVIVKVPRRIQNCLKDAAVTPRL